MTIDLLDKFLRFSEDNALFGSDSRVLLAVSGGVDSMVMLDLFRRSNTQIAVAHMNFNLRGQDSVMDAVLVRAYCLKHQIKYFEKGIPSGEFPSGNLQEQARNLRYDWFDEISAQDQWDRVATGHHLDDAVETMMMHLMTGSGIQGLSSLMMVKKQIIRPLLFAGREEISRYAVSYHVPFREDTSNASLYYRRNLIRHLLLPQMQEIEPRSKTGLVTTLEHLSKEAGLLQECIDHFSAHHIEYWKDCMRIPSGFGRDFRHREALICHIFKPYGFNQDQIKSLVQGMQVGAYLDSSDYRLYSERNYWYLLPQHLLHDNGNQILVFHQLPFTSHQNPFFEVSLIPVLPDAAGNNSLLFADPAKLKWPLYVRRRSPGDEIQVFCGRLMTKSVKKLLTDAKVETYCKSYYPVITNAEHDIICVPGICLSAKVLPDDGTLNHVAFTIKKPFDSQVP